MNGGLAAILGSVCYAIANHSGGILIVDDNEQTAQALAKVLAGANFETAVAYRGADGLDAARQAPFKRPWWMCICQT